MTAMADLKRARSVLQIVENTLQDCWLHLYEQCSEAGRLSSKKLDSRQVASFELAHSAAELTAAKHVIEYAEASPTEGGGEFEARAALVFTADAVNAIRGRLSSRPTDYDLDADKLAATLYAHEPNALVEDWLKTESLEALGEEVLERDGRLGVSLLNDEQEMIRDSFRKFAEDVVKPRAEHIHRDDLIVPDEILEGLKELGCFGLSIPERFGGLQPDDAEDSIGMIVTTEELSRGSLAAAGSLITRPEILSRALLKGGTQEQKEQWLPSIAAGDTLVGISFTEPNYGSDVAGMQFKATRTDGGWLLNGAKAWCTFAGKASLLLVLARTNPDMSLGHKGLSMFLVEKPSTDGHHFEHKQDGGGTMSGKATATIGYRGMHSFDVFFDNWFVPDDSLACCWAPEILIARS